MSLTAGSAYFSFKKVIGIEFFRFLLFLDDPVE